MSAPRRSSRTERAVSASSAALDSAYTSQPAAHTRAHGGKRKRKAGNVSSIVRAARRKSYARARPHIVSEQAYLQAPPAQPSHFDANIDPALAGTDYLEGQQQPPQYVNGVQVTPAAHPPLAPGLSDPYANTIPVARLPHKKRGVTRFWATNSSIAAARVYPPRDYGIRLPGDSVNDEQTATLSSAQADAARAQQAAQQQQQTEMSLRQGATKFGRRRVTDASRARAREVHVPAPAQYGIGVGVGVGVGAGLDAYPPMVEADEQEFELPYDIQWAAENGELDNKKRPSTYQKIRSSECRIE